MFFCNIRINSFRKNANKTISDDTISKWSYRMRRWKIKNSNAAKTQITNKSQASNTKFKNFTFQKFRY